MGIDINKIIMESIEVNKTLTENTELEPEISNPEHSNIQNQIDNKTEIESDDNDFYKFINEVAVPCAISAGIGAMLLRNKLISITEVDSDAIIDLAGKTAKGLTKIGSNVGEAAISSGKKIAKAVADGYDSSPESAKPIIAGGGALLGYKGLKGLSRRASEARDRMSSYASGGY